MHPEQRCGSRRVGGWRCAWARRRAARFCGVGHDPPAGAPRPVRRAGLRRL